MRTCNRCKKKSDEDMIYHVGEGYICYPCIEKQLDEEEK